MSGKDPALPSRSHTVGETERLHLDPRTPAGLNCATGILDPGSPATTLRIVVVQPISHPQHARRHRLSDEFAVEQGLLGLQWQRPDMYDSFFSKRAPRAAAE